MRAMLLSTPKSDLRAAIRMSPNVILRAHVDDAHTRLRAPGDRALQKTDARQWKNATPWHVARHAVPRPTRSCEPT